MLEFARGFFESSTGWENSRKKRLGLGTAIQARIQLKLCPFEYELYRLVENCALCLTINHDHVWLCQPVVVSKQASYFQVWAETSFSYLAR